MLLLLAEYIQKALNPLKNALLKMLVKPTPVAKNMCCLWILNKIHRRLVKMAFKLMKNGVLTHNRLLDDASCWLKTVVAHNGIHTNHRQMDAWMLDTYPKNDAHQDNLLWNLIDKNGWKTSKNLGKMVAPNKIPNGCQTTCCLMMPSHYWLLDVDDEIHTYYGKWCTSRLPSEKWHQYVAASDKTLLTKWKDDIQNTPPKCWWQMLVTKILLPKYVGENPSILAEKLIHIMDARCWHTADFSLRMDTYWKYSNIYNI